MAKKRTNLDDIFKKTEADRADEDPRVPATGRTLSVGVGLKEGEVEMLDQIAADLDVTRNALMRYALRYFLIQYLAGEVSPAEDVEEPEVKKRLKMPGKGA